MSCSKYALQSLTLLPVMILGGFGWEGACSMFLMPPVLHHLSPIGWAGSRAVSLCPSPVSKPLVTWLHFPEGWKAAPGIFPPWDPLPDGQLVVSFHPGCSTIIKLRWRGSRMWGQLFPDELITLTSLCLPWTFCVTGWMWFLNLRGDVCSSPCWPWGSSFILDLTYELLYYMLLLTFMSITFLPNLKSWRSYTELHLAEYYM